MILIKTLKISVLIILIPIIIYSAEDERLRMKKDAPRTKEKSIAVFIDYGNGYIDLGKTNSNNIFEGEFVYSEYRPRIKYEIVGDEGRLNIRFSGKVKKDEEDESSKRINTLNKLYDNELLLNLSGDIPLTLDLELGVIKGEMDLGGMNIKDIDLEVGVCKATIIFEEPNKALMETFAIEGGVGHLSISKLGNANFEDFDFEGGVGSYELDFTGVYKHDVSADIEMGMGKLKVYLPRNIGTRIQVDKSFLSSFSIDEVYKKGDIYYNDKWDESKYRLDLSVEAGVGKIEIIWVD